MTRAAGMNTATAAATRATPQPIIRPVRKPASEGRVKPPRRGGHLGEDHADHGGGRSEVPRERIRVLKLLAEAVSDSGTALMISAGMAP